MRRFLFAAVALGLAACDQGPVAPNEDAADLHLRGDRGNGVLRVMTRNVYVGTNVDVVLAAENPSDIPLLVAEAFQTLMETNFPERAKQLAREIGRVKPHLVGLQEISTIRIQSPGDAIVGGTTPATDVVFDYLEILLAALEQQGEHYDVVARIQNPDVEVPMLTSPDPTFDDVRLTDYDVILARRGMQIAEVVEANYAVALPIPSLGITIPRGYVAVTARMGSNEVRFVNTHLEPASIPELLPVQLGQAQELIATLNAETRPVVLVGDLNSHAPDGATYQLLLDNGFADAWTAGPRRGNGLTCCHDVDLRNALTNFNQRIDFVMGRSIAGNQLRVPRAGVLGDDPSEKTQSGLWPSDHAGVWAAMRFVKHRWNRFDHN